MLTDEPSIAPMITDEQRPDPSTPQAPDEVYQSITDHLDILRNLGTVDPDNHPAFTQIANLLTQGGETITAFIQHAGEKIRQFTHPTSAPSATLPEPSQADYLDGELYDADGNHITDTPDKLFIPGMGTTLDFFKQYMAILGTKGYVGLFNKSNNFLDDFAQSLNDRLEASLGVRLGKNPSVETLKHHLKIAVDEARPMDIIAHSQGGAILSAALNHLVREGYTEAQFSHLNITTYGSAGTAFPRGARYTHYVIIGDPVPFLAMSADIFTFSIIGVGLSYLLWRDNSLVNTVVLPAGQGKDYLARNHEIESYFSTVETPMMPSLHQSIEQLTERLQQVNLPFTAPTDLPPEAPPHDPSTPVN
jgi:hypothetical protein